MSSRPPSPEAIQLGNLKTSHAANLSAGSAVKASLYLAGICAVFGLMLVVMGYAKYSDDYAREMFGSRYAVREGLTFASVGLALMLVGIGLYGASRLLRNVRVDVFEKGFVYTSWRKELLVFRWDDITGVYETIIVGGRRSITRETYTVHRNDGQRVKLTGNIAKVAALGHTIQKEIASRRLPQAIRTYAMGETVTFGQDLGLSQHGIRYKHKLLPWSDVAGIRLNLYRDVIIMVKREGKRLSQQLVPHAGIANFMIFSAMVEQILKPDSHGQQADASKSTARGGIGELSARLGQDVRELLMQGYTPDDIQKMIAQREKGIENDKED